MAGDTSRVAASGLSVGIEAPFDGLEQQVIESRGNNQEGLSRCRIVRREAGRAELNEKESKYSWLEPLQTVAGFEFSDPVVTVLNSDKVHSIEVVIDFYDNYKIEHSRELRVQIEPGLHILKFSPANTPFGSTTHSLEGKIELLPNHMYVWSGSVKVETYTYTVYE
jgi:hypothetical protein